MNWSIEFFLALLTVVNDHHQTMPDDSLLSLDEIIADLRFEEEKRMME